MPPIKQLISDYFRTQCKRQLYFNLCQDAIPKEIAEVLEKNRSESKIVQQLVLKSVYGG